MAALKYQRLEKSVTEFLADFSKNGRKGGELFLKCNNHIKALIILQK
jgi:hypothetical protein